MTAKEKAEELVRKYYTWGINKEGQTLSWFEAKQLALIAVDEIRLSHTYGLSTKLYTYFQEVKQEILEL